MVATSSVSLGNFDSTTELRESQPPYRRSTQSRPPRESQKAPENRSRPACPPPTLPKTLEEAQNVRDALTDRSEDLDKLIAQYEHKPTHSLKELEHLAGVARCLRDPLRGDLLSAVKRLRERAHARSDFRSEEALEKVDNDLFALALKEGRRILQLDKLKEDLRLEMRCKNLPRPRTVDMAENWPVAIRGDIDDLKARVDRYLANPTREQQRSIVDLTACLRNVIKDLQATLDKFDRRARVAGDTQTRSRISRLSKVLDGLWRDIQIQDDRTRYARPVR